MSFCLQVSAKDGCQSAGEYPSAAAQVLSSIVNVHAPRVAFAASICELFCVRSACSNFDEVLMVKVD